MQQNLNFYLSQSKLDECQKFILQAFDSNCFFIVCIATGIREFLFVKDVLDRTHSDVGIVILNETQIAMDTEISTKLLDIINQTFIGQSKLLLLCDFDPRTVGVFSKDVASRIQAAPKFIV